MGGWLPPQCKSTPAERLKKAEEGMKKRYIGVDLHRNCFTACTREENGEEGIREWKLDQLGEFVKKLRSRDEVAVEISGNTRFFYEAVVGRVSRVVVVNTTKFRVISESVKKTDKNDARILALFLSKGMLPEVRLKDKARLEVASLAQTRDSMVRLRTVLKNKINNMLSARGMNLKREALASDRRLEAILKMKFDIAQEAELRVIVEQIRSLNAGIKKLEGLIDDYGRKLEGYRNIRSIKGTGALNGPVLLSAIGDVNNFEDEGKLASYFGIVPKVDQSNQSCRIGSITRCGNKLARTALIQSALVARKYSTYLDAYYQRVKKRRGAGRAIVALARKFLGVIYRTLKNNWVFEDFSTFTLASTT
jgi:transposase